MKRSVNQGPHLQRCSGLEAAALGNTPYERRKHAGSWGLEARERGERGVMWWWSETEARGVTWLSAYTHANTAGAR